MPAAPSEGGNKRKRPLYGPRTYLLWELLETRDAEGQDGAGPGRAADGLVPLFDAPGRQENGS